MPTSTKLLLFLGFLVYLLLPWDLLPDWIPLAGRLDDLAVAALIYMRYRKLGKLAEREKQAAESARDGASSARSAGSNERDPYEVFELEPGATREQIEAKYRKLCSLYHPDKVEHLGADLKKVAHEKMIEIQEAYKKLMYH